MTPVLKRNIAIAAHRWFLSGIVSLVVAMATGWGAPVTAAPAITSSARCELLVPLTAGWRDGSWVLGWATSRELGVVGFDLLKRDAPGEAWTRVNTALIAASNSPAGASYSMALADHTTTPTDEWVFRVWTEDAKFTDHTTGFQLASSATDSSFPPSRKSSLMAGADSIRESGPRLMGQSDGGPLTEVISVDVFTSRAGVHFLSFAELATAFQRSVGEIIGWADRGQLSLRQQGVRVPAWSDSTTGGVYFFAPRSESLFFAGSVTQVCFEQTALWMIGEIVSSGLTTDATYGRTRTTQERNLQPVPTLPGDAEADFWVWDSFLGGHPSFGARSYLFDLVGLERAGTAKLEVELISVSEAGTVFSVLLNGRELGSQAWSGRERRTLRFEVDPAWLQATTNTLRLVSIGDRISLGYLDRFSLDYPRRLQPTNGPILFSSVDQSILEVSGSVGSMVEVWDVTDPARPVRMQRADLSEGAETFRFQGLPAHQYATFTRGAAITPDRIRAFAADGLRDPGNRAEYLVIAPDSLATAATALAVRRAAQGLSSRVIPLSKIQHAFAFGVPTPIALARFVAHARTTWAVPPRYLMIVGDGTYDYRGFTGQTDNLVPPMVISTLFGRAVSDVLFGDLERDGRPEVAVGRLPVRTEAELVRLIGQMDEFGLRKVSLPKALVLADKPDGGGDFTGNAGELVSRMEPEFSVETILNDSRELSEARALLFEKLGAGVNLFNYVGHGGRDRFGSGYLTVSDAEATDFGLQQPLVVAMTCAAGQFGLPGVSCLGEALLLKTGRAPIAVWSPSGFSVDLQAHPLNLLLVEELRRQPVATRLGDTLRRVLKTFRELGGDEVTPELYNLLGDPALPLNFGGQLPSLSARFAGNDLQLRLKGSPGATYEVLTSDRLDGLEWTVLVEVTADASGEGGFAVALSGGMGQRFYRAQYRR